MHNALPVILTGTAMRMWRLRALLLLLASAQTTHQEAAARNDNTGNKADGAGFGNRSHGKRKVRPDE